MRDSEKRSWGALQALARIGALAFLVSWGSACKPTLLNSGSDSTVGQAEGGEPSDDDGSSGSGDSGTNGGSGSGGSGGGSSLVIFPKHETLIVGSSFVFVASGGSAPYTFSLASGGGTIHATQGTYTAPGSPGSAVIRVTDAAGASTTAQVSIVNLAAGAIDPAFGASGKVMENLISDAQSSERMDRMFVQGDGKIVAAGKSDERIAVVRYNADGTLDPSFGNGGKFAFSAGASIVHVKGLALGPSGKIYVGSTVTQAGGSDYEFCVARLNANGTLDTSFGSSGIVITELGANSYDELWSLGVQADGKVVAGGYSSAGAAVALVRYDTNGALDAAFGTGGIRTGISGYLAEGLAFQSDGKILASTIYFSYDAKVARLNTDGTDDTSFNGTGSVSTPLGSSSNSYTGSGLAIDGNGKIVVAGGAWNGTTYEIGIARYDSNGALDGTFGTGGKTVVSLDTGSDPAYALAIQSDNKIVVAGVSANSVSGKNEYFVARFDTAGALDASFGTGGFKRVLVDGYYDSGYIWIPRSSLRENRPFYRAERLVS